MKPMTGDEAGAFLTEHAGTAQCATVKDNGYPSTWQASVKAASRCREPRVSLGVDDDTPPLAFVRRGGTASLSDDPGQLLHWAGRGGGRSPGAEQAEAYGRRNRGPGELLVRVTPAGLSAKKDVAGWQG